MTVVQLTCKLYVAVLGTIVCKKKACLKCYQQNVFTNHIYLMYMYKEDLALNNLQWLICHKTKPNQIIYI